MSTTALVERSSPAACGDGRRWRLRSSSNAAFVAMRYVHVEKAARPSKRGSPRTIEIIASWAASSASRLDPGDTVCNRVDRS